MALRTETTYHVTCDSCGTTHPRGRKHVGDGPSHFTKPWDALSWWRSQGGVTEHNKVEDLCISCHEEGIYKK